MVVNMARDWRKFDFDELVYIWNGHKQKNPNIDPLRLGMKADHKMIQLTHEEIEDLVDCLLLKIICARDIMEGNR
jgi:hypothetical protein